MTALILLGAASWLGGVGMALALCRAASYGNNVEGGPAGLDVSNNGKTDPGNAG